MTGYRDLVLSDRDRKRAIAEMSNALTTMEAISKEPAVQAMRGYAYTDDDMDVLRAGRKALDQLVAAPQSNVARVFNEQRLNVAGRAVDRADMMLLRNGFIEVKDIAWTEADRQVIENALRAFQRVTAYQRG